MMQRLFRNVLFFLFGFFAVAVPMLVFADTYPATITGYRTSWTDQKCNYQSCTGATIGEACSKGTWATSGYTVVSGGCKSNTNGQIWAVDPIYSCPAGGTRIYATDTVCTRSDCAPGQHYNAAGQCIADCVSPAIQQSDGTCSNPCEGNETAQKTYQTRSPVLSVGNVICSNGCEWMISWSSVGYDCGFGGDVGLCYPATLVQIMKTPTACSSPTPDPPPVPPVDARRPPCQIGQGVITSTSGRVMCLPGGTAGTETPKTGTKTTTKTNADGSKTVTETTTTCAGAGSCSSTTTTTTINNDGSSSSDKSVTDSTSKNGGSTGSAGGGGIPEPGICEKEPELSICKKGDVSSDPGKFDTSTYDSELQQANQKLTDAINTIKASIQSKFTTITGAGSSLPCPPPVSVFNRSFSVCLTPYSDKLSIVGDAVYFIAVFLAAALVLKGIS